MFKKMLGQLVVVAALAVAASAQAAPVTWTLNNVTLSDGGTASGWFVWDASTQTGGAFNFTTTSGSILSGAGYDSTGTGFFWGNGTPGSEPNGFAWFSGGLFDPYLDLIFENSLTNAGGTVALVGTVSADHPWGGGFECGDRLVCETARYVTGGSVTGESAQDVPEPASIALLGAGLVGLGLARRRKAA